MPEVDLAAAFAGFERSAWRVCARDDYLVPEEAASLAAWTARRQLLPRADGWTDLVRGKVRAGARMGRVQLITPPAGPYVEWLLAGYGANVEAGEEVRLAYRDVLEPDLAAWAEDVWVFDDALAVRLQYDEQGRFQGADDVTGSLDQYLAVRGRLLAASVPLNMRMDNAVGQ